MPRTLSQKSSFHLLLWGFLMVPAASIADAVLNAVLFDAGTLREQLLAPSSHEISVRLLFSTFIMAAIYLGMHYLAKTAQKAGSLHQRNNDLGLIRQDLEEFQENILRQLRNTSSELSTSIAMMRGQENELLNEKSRFFIESIAKTSDRLSKQLDISLGHLEFPSGELRRERVKLDQLANDVASELRSRQPHRQIEFTIQPWIDVWCDKTMLRAVIYNLFADAMSRIPQSRQGKIEFGLFNRKEQKVLFVRHNGAGFSEGQAQRLFEIFSGENFEEARPQGANSLASARRIINRHGGQIWAEGIPEVGGTIYFTYYTP